MFEGYAAVFNIPDKGSDIILPGCFKESLLRRSQLGKVFPSDIRQKNTK